MSQLQWLQKLQQLQQLQNCSEFLTLECLRVFTEFSCRKLLLKLEEAYISCTV